MGGFAKAHNANVKRGNAEYVLILNPDVFVEPDCIEAAIDCTMAHRGLIVGAHFHNDRSVWLPPDWSGAVRPNDDFDESLCQRVPHVMGAFMLLRRETWQDVGGFDERFSPIYYEDLDICLRVGNCWHCGKAHATHIGCATTDRMKWRRRYWHAKNRLKFLYKWRIECAY